jgi:hypothetical protein
MALNDFDWQAVLAKGKPPGGGSVIITDNKTPITPEQQAALDYNKALRYQSSAQKQAEAMQSFGVTSPTEMRGTPAGYMPTNPVNLPKPAPDNGTGVIGGNATGTSNPGAPAAPRAPVTTPPQRFGAPQGVPQAPRFAPQAGMRSPALGRITDQFSGNYSVPRMNPNAWYNNWQGANPFSMSGNPGGTMLSGLRGQTHLQQRLTPEQQRRPGESTRDWMLRNGGNPDQLMQPQQVNRAVNPSFVQGNMPSNFTGMSGQSGFQDQLAQMLAQYKWPLYF